MSRISSVICLLTFAWLMVAPLAAQETRLLRHPDLHEDQVVFTYAGDLWIAPSTGGDARRLTTHPGLELFGKFSPDGSWVAFTGQYDGDEQVYVVPTAGGAPRQLTFYPAAGPLAPRWGYDNQVYDWTADGERVLFRSLRDGWDLGDTQLFTVATDGGLPKALPMPESGGGDLSPDGSKAVYSPVTRDFRHWKRYEGGWAQDLYIFDLAAHDTRRVTDHPRSDRDPMWIGERIYFSSDRDGTLNLFSHDPASGSTEQLTHSKLWDLRWPSADKASGRIVYERQGGLEIYEIETKKTVPISIRVPTDGLAKRPSRISAAQAVSYIGLSPKGERALFAARGDIFTAPIEHGTTRNLTRTSDANDREPAWSPEGDRIAFVSDQDGEEEIYSIGQLGGEITQLTDGSVGRYYSPDWSPDGTHIAYQNQAQKLFVLEVTSRTVTEVADDVMPFGMTYTWSPDGAFLALSLADEEGTRALHIWSRVDQQLHRVTGTLFNEHDPTWSADGDYLYFLSEREFRPQLGGFEFNYVVNRATHVYALALREDVGHPFPARSDEVEIEKEEPEADEDKASEDDDPPAKKRGKGKGKGKGGKGKPADKDAPMKIDFDGLAARVARVPLAADNYFGLGAIEGQLLYVTGPASYYGRSGVAPVTLWAYNLEDRESTEIVSGVSDLTVSADGKKMLARVGGQFKLLAAGAKGKNGGKTVSTSGLQVDRVPAEEWSQIFEEVWRRFRDFFYVENMHGYDWAALREQYRPLLEHVAHRSDLNYVISEMIGELNVGHAYISGGDYVIPDRPDAALLGARFALDEASGRFRLARIFPGQNEEDTYRSPLTEVGVNVDEGDYLLAINGVELGARDNPFALLRHAGGGPVELMVHDQPTLDGARQVRVAPIDNEDDLIYLAWTDRARQAVASESDGRIGYVHLPNMGADGLREWIKWYYGQTRKEGMIIDVRSNGGGNVSGMIIERLRRELLMVDFERNQETPDTYPGGLFYGHLVCLLDEDTASDGDQFSYVFREAGLGPLIGKRSWGGVVGIYGRSPLIDGGSLSVPEAGSANPEGEWVVEGYGVEPDIVIEQDPKAVLAGRDPQLEKAIAVLMEKIENDPKTLPPRPAAPDKSQ